MPQVLFLMHMLVVDTFKEAQCSSAKMDSILLSPCTLKYHYVCFCIYFAYA